MTKEKKNKPSKELPLGFVDRQEKELLVRDFIISNIKEILIKYGFQYLETPSFEYSDSIGKFLPDKDRPDEGVFSFKDENKWLSLRYDLTAPLARYVAKNYLEISKPFKRYQLGTVWRNEKPGPGRFREFLQFDADYVGTDNLLADAELCIMASEILAKCGLEKKDYIININNRKITDEWINKLNLDFKDINDLSKAVSIYRAIDKIDRIGLDGVIQLLGKGRKDKSGDFTKGADLSDSQIAIIKKYLIEGEQPMENVEGWDELIKIEKIFSAYKFNNYKITPSVVRGLEYYTGPIFEIELKFGVKNSSGQTVKFGSIGGGGRYDNLVSNFGNIDCPATGISIGLDRLVFALMQKKDFDIKAKRPVIICVFESIEIEEYINILNKLRDSKISSEIYSGVGKLKKQMEYANKINSPAVILYGDNEKKLGKVILKNLKSGKEESVEIERLSNEIKKII